MSDIVIHTGDYKMIETIRNLAPTNEIDYNFLMGCLSGYSQPRDKISRLIKSGAIIRVKKGLYVFGPKYSRGPFSRETLANLIYGPSYISLDYALSFYGLIPERIEVVTSMTNKRNKFFKTPAGNFSYTYIHPRKYHIGMEQIKLDESHNIIIASKEKALADKVSFLKGVDAQADMIEYLTQDLRIDKASLKTLGAGKLKKIAAIYENKKVDLLYRALKEKK